MTMIHSAVNDTCPTQSAHGPVTRRRIALVSPYHWTSATGGAELQMRFLLDRLVELDRFDVAYFTANVSSCFSPRGYRIYSLRKTANSRSTLNDIKPLLRALATFNPHVIYQRVGGPYTGAAAWYARRAGARMVWHIALDSDVVPGLMPTASKLRLSRWLEKKALEFGIQRANVIIAQTKKQKVLLSQHYNRKSVVVANAHPVPAPKEKPDGPFVCLWIANLKPTKQPEVLLRLARRMKENQLSLKVIGRAQDPRYRGLVADLRMLGNVEFLGELPFEAVNDLLDRAHLLINTSVLEGFPNTFIQAWLREVPVASLTVDPDKVLSREGLGFCADSCENRLADWIEEFARNPKQRAEIGRTARDYAMGIHSLANVDDIITLLERSK